MNEILQVLMYFFERAGHDRLFCLDEQFLVRELEQLGIPVEGIDEILSWVHHLTPPTEQIKIAEYPLQAHSGMRVFSPTECTRLSKKCRGLLLSLERTGILNPTTRELVLDELMHLNPEDISFSRIKWVTLMVLAGQSDKLASACMERFLLQESSVEQLH